MLYEFEKEGTRDYYERNEKVGVVVCEPTETLADVRLRLAKEMRK